MTLGQSTDWTSVGGRERIAWCAAHAVFFIAVVATTVLTAVAGAAAQGSPYRAGAFPHQTGTLSPLLSGGIFQADLNHTVNVAGWVETFGWMPRRRYGQWTISPPGDGIANSKIVGATPIGSCAPNPPCDATGPNPKGPCNVTVPCNIR